jgi:hypothetical protein
VLALGLSASLLVPVTAHAADPPAGKAPGVSRDEARADAEKRLSEGLDRYAKGDYEGARLAFAQAYAVLTSIDLLYNLMRAEVKSGHPLEALVHIHQMLRDPNATSEDHAKAQRLLDEANRVTGHIAVDAPAGAEIVVDDVPSGEAPVKEPFDVTPGKHKVEARAGANRPRVDVDAPAGEIVTARFAMDMKAPTVSAPVPIALPAPASPREPNEPVGATSPAPHAEEHAHEHVSSKARIVVPVVVGAVAVVALGVGIGMGVAAQGKESDATSFRQNNPQGFCSDRGSAACGQYKSLLDSQETDTSVSRAMFVTGGVLAAAAIVTFFVWPRDRREPGEVRSAWIAPTIGGVSAGGTF